MSPASLSPTAASTARRAALIERNLAELLTHDELAALLAVGGPIRHYIGYEISGRVHLGGGLVAMSKVRDFMEAGVECTLLLADWHTWINDKLGGDRDRIRRIAVSYFGEAMKASLLCVGGDPSALRVVLASDLYRDVHDYWAVVVEVAKHTSVARMQRSITILGRREGDSVDFAKLLYPAMQAADVFALGAHIAHAGMDQRKAHVVARDVATRMRILPLRNGAGKTIKPLAAHHPLITGLLKPDRWPVPPEQRTQALAEMKMSKSNPRSAVFIHDSPDEIRRKVRGAFCPPEETELNPVVDWIAHLCFGLGDEEFQVGRTPENGGPVTFHAMEEVREAYSSGGLHPMDAKTALADRLIERLEPARLAFADPDRAAALAEMEQLIH
jgi:tyrosyl-tRNA synthetase